ncbi:MAG: hypothetical protein M0R80_00010 [Proteobacteria bacterium]|jgi:hypothetical protein|nr:hypothetical protein [Pseudomonadota bacterium]
MHRIIPPFLVIEAAILASSCERSDTPPIAIVGSASALYDDESVGEIETPLDAKEDPPPHPIEVEWTDGAASTDSPSVSFSLTNTTNAAIEYAVSLYSRSLVGEAERPIGEGEIWPGEGDSYVLNASELPVVSDKVVGSLSVRIRRIEALPGGERAVVEDRATRFIVHSDGYSTVRAFDENKLREERDGVLVSLPLPKSGDVGSTEHDVVGEVWNGAGFTEKAKEDSGLLLRDEGGDVYAVINEMKLDSELPTEPIEAPPDEGDLVETEVDDE